MYVVKQFTTAMGLTKFLRGEEIHRGTVTSDGADIMVDDDGTDLGAIDTPVAVGHVAYIGDGGGSTASETVIYEDATPGSDEVYGDPEVGTVTAQSWRITTEKHEVYGPSQNVVHIERDPLSSTWVVIYDTDKWSNG